MALRPLVLPRYEVFESITEVHNRGTPTPNHHKRLNESATALEGNAAGVDASLESLETLTAQQEVIIEDLGDVVNEQADLLAQQITINDRQDDQALEILDVTDGLIAAVDQQAVFSSELAAQADDIIAALGIAFDALDQAEAVDTQLDAVDNALRELIKDRIGYQATITASPGAGGIYDGTWVSTGAFPVGESVSLSLSFAVPKGSTFFHVQLSAVTSSTFRLYLFDATGAAITTGSYSVFIAFRSAPAA
jgi:hypothetical protein